MSHDATRDLERIFAKKSRFGSYVSHWYGEVNAKTLFVIATAGLVATALYITAIRPPEAFPLNELITIEGGTTLTSASLLLKDHSVIRSPIVLRLLVSLMGSGRGVQAGDYLFKEPKDVLGVARTISRGVYGLEPIRIRVLEGATVSSVAHLLDTYLLRFDAERFIAEAKEHEGYLFPDTYFFLPNATEEIVLRSMRQNFEAKSASIAPQIEAFGKPFRDVVIMASLLEREANTTEDRRMIAGVLWNRLERDMLLQVDAAFLYTLGKGTFDLTTEDLASDSPYNTYRFRGLPPTPIGSPSLDSLLSAVTPVHHTYLFYLADKNHVTYYSKTYQEHLRKKALYLGT
ncbi:MAG TPA: endolytic transglycosylase MltG [Candidatus Paceibacterota bacterium]